MAMDSTRWSRALLSAGFGLTLAAGMAIGQEAATQAAGSGQPEAVGGLDVPAEGEAVQPTTPAIRGYITDPLWVGTLSQNAMLTILQRETRKMKLSPPTPEELKVTPEQSELIEQAFADHQEEMRKYNNEVALDRAGLRERAGFEIREPDSLDEDEDFSPMLYINPDLIEPSGVGEAAIKVPRLSEEQADARDALRAIELAGPLTENVQLVVLGVLSDEQGEMLLSNVDEVVTKRLREQEIRERVKRTGVLTIDDVSPEMREKLMEMEPRKRQAVLDKRRMTMFSGGPLKLKRHRDKVKESIQRKLKPQDEKVDDPEGMNEEAENSATEG